MSGDDSRSLQQEQGLYNAEGRRVFNLPKCIDENGVLTCPLCGCKDFRVSNTYGWEAGGNKRRRECRNCKWSIRTVEVPLQEG